MQENTNKTSTVPTPVEKVTKPCAEREGKKSTWEEIFGNLRQQYKDETFSIKTNSKRLCEKIHELEVAVLEQSIPLEKAHKLILEKDQQIAEQKVQHADLHEKYISLQKRNKELKNNFAKNESIYSAYIDEMNEKLYEIEKSLNDTIQQQNEEITKLIAIRDELMEKVSKQADITQLQEQLKSMSKDHIKHMEELKKSFANEKIFVETKYKKIIEDLNNSTKEDMEMRKKEICELKMNNNDLLEIKMNLNQKCEDLQKEVDVQQNKIEDIQRTLKISTEENNKKIEELRNSFAEQKSLIEAEYKKHIEEVKQLHIDDLENQQGFLLQKSKEIINQQTNDINCLQEEVESLKKNVEQMENENKRLSDEYKYKMNKIGSVFNNPVGCLPPQRPSHYEILKPQMSAQQRKSAPLHEFFSTKNATTSKFQIRKRPTFPPPVTKENISISNSSNELNTTVIPAKPAKPRAAKRNIDYAAMLKSDIEDDEESTGANEPSSKQTRTTPSQASSSEIRFEVPKPSENTYEFDQEVAETSEDDPFDQLKGKH